MLVTKAKIITRDEFDTMLDILPAEIIDKVLLEIISRGKVVNDVLLVRLPSVSLVSRLASILSTKGYTDVVYRAQNTTYAVDINKRVLF